MKLKATQINQNILCSWIERINIFKMFIPQIINVIPTKISIFHRTRTNKPKIWMEPQKITNSQSNLEKEKQNLRNQGIKLPDFKLNCKATAIKTVQYWTKTNTHINGIEQSLEILVSLWSTDLRQMKEEYTKHSLFNKWCWDNRTTT